MKKLFTLLICLISASAFAQNIVSGTITGSQCLSISSQNSGTVGISVQNNPTGSAWTGTIQPQVAIGDDPASNTQVTPSGSSTAQGTITANGVYYMASSGSTLVQVCGNTVTNTAKIKLFVAQYSKNFGSGGGVGSTAFNAITTGTNTTATMKVGQGASLTPDNASIVTPFGQSTGSGEWLPIASALLYPPAPTLTSNTTGGSLTTSAQVYVRLTYVGPATIQPSGEVNTGSPFGMQGCVSGNQCSVTVNMPTSCTAGNLPATVTGCTVWYATTGGTNTEQQMAGCTNITAATCTITAAPSGSAISFQTTSGVLPPGAQAPSGVDKIIPITYIQKADNNYYPFFGIDTTSINNSAPHGIPTIMQPLFYNDTNAPPLIANVGGISVHHQMSNNQNASCPTSGSSFCADFAFAVEDIDTNATIHDFTQSLSQYNERQLFDPLFVCHPSGTESCAAAGRFVFADNRTSGSITPGGLGFNGLAGVAFNNMGASHGTTGGSYPYIGVIGISQDNTASAFAEGGIAYVGGSFQATDVGSGTSSQGINILSAKGGNFTLGNRGLDIESFTTARNTDFAMFVSGGYVWFDNTAQLYLDSITTNKANITVTGSIVDTGDFATVALAPAANLAAITFGGTGGATNWTYNAGCVSASGAISMYVTPVTTALGNANLTGTNFNILRTGGMPNGCTSINFYRTLAGGTCNSGACGTGFIGNVAVPAGGSLATLPPNLSPFITFNDTGIVATGGTTSPAAASNNTGGILAAGLINGTNTVAVSGANFTTSSASLVTITGLSWTLDNTNAQSLSFTCDLAYQDSSASAVAFGIQAATNNPSNISAVGTQQITVGPPATYTSGTLPTLATTTATNIVTGTPGATATNYVVHLGGKIRNPANTANTINIMASTAAGTLTVLQDSTCSLLP